MITQGTIEGTVNRPLTEKQRIFVDAYIETGNKAEAYRRAYDISGMSPATVFRKAVHVSSNPRILAEVERRLAESRERNPVTRDRVVHMLASIAFGDIGELMSWDNNGLQLTPSKDMHPDVRKMVKGVKIRKRVDADGNETSEVELSTQDQIKAAELLGRHLGMWQQDASANAAAINVTLNLAGGPGPGVVDVTASPAPGGDTPPAQRLTVAPLPDGYDDGSRVPMPHAQTGEQDDDNVAEGDTERG